MSGASLLAAGLVRAHRIMPRAAGYVHTSMFIDTRGLGRLPADLCPLGARRIELTDVPRVRSAYLWGSDEPTVLALHGWGADSTTMSTVVEVAETSGESPICFDAPGHGVSPGTRATMSEYAHATLKVLQGFPSIHTIVAHSLGSIAAISAVVQSDAKNLHDVILLAPACSLSGVLERWAAQRRLPRDVVAGIYRDLERRDGVPVSHWDIRTLGLPSSVRLRILHDPADEWVPISDSYQISAKICAEVGEAAAGIGHHGIVTSDDMRVALTACLKGAASTRGRGHG